MFGPQSSTLLITEVIGRVWYEIHLMLQGIACTLQQS
jgi:hypothetical protein